MNADTVAMVYSILRSHTATNPITDREIVKRIGIRIRQVSRAVETLIREYGVPIGASRNAPFGRYIIRTGAELDRYCATLKAVIKATQERLYAVERNFYNESGQLDLLDSLIYLKGASHEIHE